MSYFDLLWSNYPKKDPCDAVDKQGKILFANQCAIRLSWALTKSGIPLATFPQKRKCWVHATRNEALSAFELANWLDEKSFPHIKRSVEVTGENWRSLVSDKQGIICFEDYYVPTGGAGGDHIDLWDGKSLTGIGSWLRIRFNIVIPGYWSDFKKSRRIRFFEVTQ